MLSDKVQASPRNRYHDSGRPAFQFVVFGRWQTLMVYGLSAELRLPFSNRPGYIAALIDIKLGRQVIVPILKKVSDTTMANSVFSGNHRPQAPVRPRKQGVQEIGARVFGGHRCRSPTTHTADGIPQLPKSGRRKQTSSSYSGGTQVANQYAVHKQESIQHVLPNFTRLQGCFHNKFQVFGVYDAADIARYSEFHAARYIRNVSTANRSRSGGRRSR